MQNESFPVCSCIFRGAKVASESSFHPLWISPKYQRGIQLPPFALTLPGIVLFTLKSGLISQQWPHISLRWTERPCCLFLPPPLLNRIHGGSHSPGNSPLSDANRGHGHDSARIELHESTGKHVSYGNGSWLQCLYHGAHSSGILVSLGTAQVQPVFCSFQKLSKCNKHQPCQKGLVSASCLRTADWATFSVYAPPWKSARWLQRAKGGRGRDRKTMRQIYSGWGVGGRRRERTRAVKRLQPLLVLVPVWMAELCTHSGFPRPPLPLCVYLELPFSSSLLESPVSLVTFPPVHYACVCIRVRLLSQFKLGLTIQYDDGRAWECVSPPTGLVIT